MEQFYRLRETRIANGDVAGTMQVSTYIHTNDDDTIHIFKQRLALQTVGVCLQCQSPSKHQAGITKKFGKKKLIQDVVPVPYIDVMK